MLLSLGIIVATAFAWQYVTQVRETLPTVSSQLAGQLPTASFVYAADGSELARYGDEHRIWVDLNGIAPGVVDGLLATEDRRFFQHNGIDWIRIGGAAVATSRGRREGASTLTMQLVRNLYPDIRSMSKYQRKLRELLMAREIELAYTKTEILELYLNTMSFGQGAFGIEAAARSYFDVSAKDLKLHQASLLVGLLKGPSLYDPVRNPDRALERRNLVLRNLFEAGGLTDVGLEVEQGRPLDLNQPPRHIRSVAPHFTEYARREVERWARSVGLDLYRDGLRVYTSIDPYLQRLAEESVTNQLLRLRRAAGEDWRRRASDPPFADFWRQNQAFEDQLIRASSRFLNLRRQGVAPATAFNRVASDPVFIDSLRADATRLEAGFVVLDPFTGEVRAWVGSSDFSKDQYDKVSQARRQPGSTFKPLVFAAALESGYSPEYLAEDVVKTYYLGPEGKPWRPTNSGGGASGAVLTLRRSLALSKNTVAARLIQQIGPGRVTALAERMGIESPLLPVPSLALGTSEVTLLEMTSAYGVFATNGRYTPPLAVRRVERADGSFLAEFSPDPTVAMSGQTAYSMLSILEDVVDRGTATILRREFRIPGDIAGKTGTTQSNADGWFILVHPQVVVGAWVGFNRPIVRFRSDYWGQGGHNALAVAGEFMERAIADPVSGIRPGRFRAPAGYQTPRAPANRYAGNLIDAERVRELREEEARADSVALSTRMLVW